MKKEFLVIVRDIEIVVENPSMRGSTKGLTAERCILRKEGLSIMLIGNNQGEKVVVLFGRYGLK